MQKALTVLTLMPQHSRLINATAGMRLDVRSGCLWLTRPGDSVDRFLAAGASMELHENDVLIEATAHGHCAEPAAACYTLTPLKEVQQPATAPRPIVVSKKWLWPSWNMRKQLLNT